MQLWAGPTRHFIQHAVHNAIASKLADAFNDQFRYKPGPAEVSSWKNSLRAMSQVLQVGELESTSVLLEYQLPMSSQRLDCMVLGEDDGGQPSAHIVELKQWEQARPCDVPGCVLTWVGGAEREVLHPSAQVFQYKRYLEDMHTSFRGADAVALEACSYLHNASRRTDSELLDARYAGDLERAPLFFGTDATDLASTLRSRVGRGDPGHVLDRVARGEHRPSKALMHHVASMIEGHEAYTLLDEQLVIFNTILAKVRQGYHGTGKEVVVVKGGPGTGKSVIAANLVAVLSRQDYATFHATGSRAFTENLRRAVGARAKGVFKYFFDFVSEKPNALDVLICDEAHRIRQSSNHRFTRAARKSDREQVLELIDVARVPVFFIDDMQVVRPGEVGSSELIRRAAATRDIPIKEFELDVQFRCKGSEGFVNWVDNTLAVRRTPEVLWNEKNEFDFQIVGSVEELDARIRERHDAGNSARLVAGFCWPWSKELVDGRLAADVQIGGWNRPWNARPEVRSLPKGIPKSNYWATDPNGIDQVGCIYTAQGFEFDYVGVIIGRDLRYDPTSAMWIGDRSQSADAQVKRARTDEEFLQLVKCTYRVLLTRGLKGCYVTFLDRDTEAFVRSRVESRVEQAVPLAVDAVEREPVQAHPQLRKLTRRGLELWPLFARYQSGPSAVAEEVLISTANDVAWLLDRDDVVGWELDAARREAVRTSLRRVLSDIADREELVERILERPES